jgi:glycosyltransferase involved in cell wall biosynthesis
VRTLVIIPAFNEEASLGAVLRELAEQTSGFDVLVVDDGSRDATTTIARDGGARVITLPFNVGVGGALRAGFRYASLEGYERAIQVDADGQHEPTEIKKLLDALDEGADLAIGTRFGERGDYEVSWLRRRAMRLLQRLVKMLSGRTFTDTTSGFRAFSHPLIEMFSRGMSDEYMADTVEALLRALKAGYTVAEVPVEMRPRAGGRPSHRHIMLAYHFARLIVVMLSTASRRHPPADTHDAAPEVTS